MTLESRRFLFCNFCFCVRRWLKRGRLFVLLCSSFLLPITKTYLYNFDPLKPHLYIVKLEFTGVYIIFLISAQKHRLWVLVRTVSPRRLKRVPTIHVLSRNMKKKYQNFYLKTQFLEVKFSIYLNRCVFVMLWSLRSCVSLLWPFLGVSLIF